MAELYPLRFAPRYRQYVWGGRRLATLLGKPLGAGDDFAESWELVDRGAEQSVVLGGPLAGQTLHELLLADPAGLLGVPSRCARFPLLVKFLDANRPLSVQVHPNDAQAAQLSPPDLGKTEAWVVLHADADAVLYAGLERGWDRPAFERELRSGTVERCLHRLVPRVGDCIFLPAGVVHALGAGLVVAEIQQSSDTTFRLYDWNRLGSDGRPRPLHLDAGLAVIDFELGPIEPQRPVATTRPGVERLVDCEQFVLDRATFAAPLSVGGDRRFHVVVVLEGEVRLEGDPLSEPLQQGSTALLPAGRGAVIARPAGRAVVLDAYLPT